MVCGNLHRARLIQHFFGQLYHQHCSIASLNAEERLFDPGLFAQHPAFSPG
jgi:hypothetical protein